MQKTEHLQFKMKEKSYPGTKKRPFPFGKGQGQMQSAHKSDGDHQANKFGTPGGFDDHLDDFAIDAKINEEDNEDSEFHDHED